MYIKKYFPFAFVYFIITLILIPGARADIGRYRVYNHAIYSVGGQLIMSMGSSMLSRSLVPFIEDVDKYASEYPMEMSGVVTWTIDVLDTAIANGQRGDKVIFSLKHLSKRLAEYVELPNFIYGKLNSYNLDQVAKALSQNSALEIAIRILNATNKFRSDYINEYGRLDANVDQWLALLTQSAFDLKTMSEVHGSLDARTYSASQKLKEVANTVKGFLPRLYTTSNSDINSDLEHLARTIELLADV